MNDIIVLYHNDEDGFAGAWVAWQKFKNAARYIPINYTRQDDIRLKNKIIYMIDFCYSEKSKMKEILKHNKKVVVIDHHISQKETAKIATENIYNNKNSACVLVWKYFNPKKSVPNLLKYIEDRDLWKFKMKLTREITASLNTYPFDFSIWNKISKDFQNVSTIKKYINMGRAIIAYQNAAIKSLVEDGIKAKINGYSAIAVNSPILHSEIGHYIWENYPNTIGLIWYSKNGKIKVSLRSNRKINVAKIAQKFGGGGHKQASGFSFDCKLNFPWEPKKHK